ncbi:MAG: sulfatase [Acidobacteriota bacterium]|nr:sulfatase [Acidobacteriota bacterium]
MPPRPPRRAPVVRRVLWMGWGVALGLLAACGPGPETVVPSVTTPPPPTRGVILLSLDTLGAAHLGAYGYERDTSPFLDELATRGVLFENAVVQYPSTLVSHMSMFSGLYPQEHGVYRDLMRLASEIVPLPEVFSRAGFTTAGFTEDGYVSAKVGFDRGFDVFAEAKPGGRAVEKTLAKGLEFLNSLEADERFFLFLHTYAVHPPYEPPTEYRGLFWEGKTPEKSDVSAQFVREVYMGRRQLTSDGAAYLSSQYDALVRYLDDSLAAFFDRIESLGLKDEITVVVTSDHGEEFLEHRVLGHYQVYPATLFVPLIVLHPQIEGGRRVSGLVESVDLLPTLCELSGFECPPRLSGRSLVAELVGGTVEAEATDTAYAEVLEQESVRTLVARDGGRLVQILRASRIGEPGGTWMARSIRFDAEGEELTIRLVSFARPREVFVRIDEEEHPQFTVGEEWKEVTLNLGHSGRHRVELLTDGCDVPKWLGRGDDSRCLSLKIQGVELERTELFDLTGSRWNARDVSLDQPELLARLVDRLENRRFELVAPPVEADSGETRRDELRALGYVD